MKILFLTLKVFSATGGIEKVCRVAGKALYEYGLENDASVHVMSMHDKQDDARFNAYFPAENFTGYAGAKTKCMLAAVKEGRHSDVVIISHINLLSAGWLMKASSRRTKIILLAHGIEVWGPLKPHKDNLLQYCDLVVSVSSFTANILTTVSAVDPQVSTVMNNCLDPFLAAPKKDKDGALAKKLGIAPGDRVLLTLSRISEKDRYKGYDYVMDALAGILHKYPNLKYLLAGSYDAEEKAAVDKALKDFGMEDRVIMPGFIEDSQIPSLFSLADMYIMPSMKEGFGIVFIEAMYYGVPVIGGNMDGSVDALLNGKLGTLIKPDSPREITIAIENILANPEKFAPDESLLMENFGYETYKGRLNNVLKNFLTDAPSLSLRAIESYDAGAEQI